MVLPVGDAHTRTPDVATAYAVGVGVVMCGAASGGNAVAAAITAWPRREVRSEARWIAGEAMRSLDGTRASAEVQRVRMPHRPGRVSTDGLIDGKQGQRSAPAVGRAPQERESAMRASGELEWVDELIRKINERSVRIGVIGLGYVGLSLAVEFAKAGLRVTGIEIDADKVTRLQSGQSYVQDVKPYEVKGLIADGKLLVVDDYSVLKELDAVSICVPTPLSKTKDPDISYIAAATRQIVQYLHPGQLIVLESTTYPGTTDEVILPELQQTGLQVGREFFLAFSPERIDPGNPRYRTHNTPKIIGGVTPQCARVAKSLYELAIERVIPVSSARTAEMVKLLENTFRAVNIALVNEVALMCDRLQIDVWEVIEAAATKPFGFMPFYPGPGLGGHCIPVDPFYLAWKLKTLDYKARFIELAAEINTSMPWYVVAKVVDALNERCKSVNGSNILVLGVTYKRDTNDMRESPALDIIRILQGKGAIVNFHDAYVAHLDSLDGAMHVPLTSEIIQAADCVIIATDHSQVDYHWVASQARLIVDTRNVTKHVPATSAKIIKL
jgi:UDP-N-acetyl-D-glucosamine dehydrogenase